MGTKTKRWMVLGALAGLAFGTGVANAKKETNRQVMDRWFATVDSKQTDKLAALEAADFEMKVPGMPVIKGPEGHAQLTKGFATAFPNFKHVVSRCIESGETIACEGHFVGDHTGPMGMPNGQSIPPTNKHVDFEWGGIAVIKNGKLASCNVYFDNMALMGQLGLLPPPPSAPQAKK